jgi:ribosome-binding protein aMBF1 (putative translation factor)
MRGFPIRPIIGGLMGRQARGSNKLKESQISCSPTSIKEMPNSNEKFHLELIFQLVRRRKRMKISQKELGEKIGIADYLLAKWEGGHRRPSGFLLWCWAESLGVKLVLKETSG